MPVTGEHNYFEDFTVGETFEHARGKTVGEFENHLVTHMTMNTAEGHFNEEFMARGDNPMGETRIVVGYLVLAIVVGLTSEDISENAITDLSYDNIRFTAPTEHGDTLYARSEVVAIDEADDRDDAGIVTFHITGHNQDGEQVCETTRRVLLRKRAHWR